MFCELFELFFSGEGSQKSGCGEDQASGAMVQAITVHPNAKKVMYFA